MKKHTRAHDLQRDWNLNQSQPI